MIKVYPTIASFAASIGRAFDQDFDFTIHRTEELHGTGPIKSPSFRTEYHAFLLVESGKGQYTIDQQTFPLGPGSFYFTNPGHVKSFEMSESVEGYIITFTDRFLQSHYAGDLAATFPFLFDHTTPVMQLKEADYVPLHHQAQGLMTAYATVTPFRPRILAHLMIAFLFHTKSLSEKYADRLVPDSRAELLAADFQRLLTEALRELPDGGRIPQVQELADALHVQPAYLSEAVKGATGKNPKEWIDERVITEAQTLLLNTRMTVAEIAFRMGYDDASNFSRFFRRQTGEGPARYRKAHQ